MLVWVKSINAQKESLSYLYGHLLLIPFMILKSNTRISSSLKDAVEYLDGWFYYFYVLFFNNQFKPYSNFIGAMDDDDNDDRND